MSIQIDKEKIREVFQSYTGNYDLTDEKIKLKVSHTYRVARLCERIAISENMTSDEVSLAWVLGMLHDVGRFEQLRRYGTFIDAESIDHAALGADILFHDGKIRDYLQDEEEDELIETAVRVHSAYRILEGLDERTEKFCHILRDADKIDILKVNVEVPLEEIYNTSTEILLNASVSQEVMDAFYEHHCVLKTLKKTPVDHVVGHISLTYELVYPESLKIMKEQGYLQNLLNFRSENPETRAQFQCIREEMERYLKEKLEKEAIG